jgi:hypothetical protein
VNFSPAIALVALAACGVVAAIFAG